VQDFVIGQRWINDAELQMGLGTVMEVEQRTVTIEFQASGETRTYARQTAPLTRITFTAGDVIHSRQTIKANVLKTKTFTCPVLGDANVQLALESNLRMSQLLSQQIKRVEKAIMSQVTPCTSFELLKSACGIGDVLAETILPETGDIKRFRSPGNYASYCRCVDSRKMSNGKKKGEGNRKNGNRYLAWAFIEAANFAIRYNEKAKRFYNKKSAKTNRIIALKALAHKIARACYYIMLREEPFDENKLFA
jgi:transposase